MKDNGVVRDFVEDIWTLLKLKEVQVKIATVGLGIGIGFLGLAIGNRFFNNQTLTGKGYTTHSFASWISTHTEYTKYDDGSQDVKRYPGLSFTYIRSQFDQDLDGDGCVDRIRETGYRMDNLKGLLVRSNHYQENKDRFDRADRRLQGLIKRFSKGSRSSQYFSRKTPVKCSSR